MSEYCRDVICDHKCDADDLIHTYVSCYPEGAHIFRCKICKHVVS